MSPPNIRSCTLPSVELADIVALQRSAAMLQPGQALSVDREELMALCEEVVASRQLLARLGADLRTVAARAKRDQ